MIDRDTDFEQNARMERDPNSIVHLKLRFREELRRLLEDAASRSDRSLNSELVARLEASFRDDEQLGGGEQSKFFRDAQALMDRVSREMGTKWTEDHDGWAIVRSGLIYLLTEIEPPAAPAPDLPSDEVVADAVSKYAALHAEWERQGVANVERQTELHIRKQSHGLTPLEEQEEAFLREEYKNKFTAAHAPEPDLPEEMLRVWKNIQTRQTRIQKATRAAVAVLPKPKDR